MEIENISDPREKKVMADDYFKDMRVVCVNREHQGPHSRQKHACSPNHSTNTAKRNTLTILLLNGLKITIVTVPPHTLAVHPDHQRRAAEGRPGLDQHERGSAALHGRLPDQLHGDHRTAGRLHHGCRRLQPHAQVKHRSVRCKAASSVLALRRWSVHF